MFLHENARQHLPQLYALRSALTSQISLMRKLLLWNEPSMDHRFMQQALHGEHRTVRLGLFFRAATSEDNEDGHFLDAQRRTLATLSHEHHWKFLEHTEASASMIFRTMLRPAALLHELLIVKCSTYPYKLMALCDNPELAGSILEDYRTSPCKLDPFSRQFVSEFAGVERLQSPESLFRLQAVGLSAKGNHICN